MQKIDERGWIEDRECQDAHQWARSTKIRDSSMKGLNSSKFCFIDSQNP